MANIKDNKQSGVTLLLAILILSSILAISFSLATILFIEVRTSGDLLRTEAALYGAEAVSEGALFGLQHKVPSSIMDYANIAQTSDGRVSLTSTTSPLSDVQNDIVPKSAIDFEHAKRYGLYDVSAQDSAKVGSGYGKFKVTILPNGNQDRLQVWVCEFAPELSINIYPDCIDSDGFPHQTLKGTLSTRPAMPSTGDWLLDPTMQQELVLVNAEGSSATDNLYIEIEAFGPETSPGSGIYLSKGLPNFDRTVVDINAVNSGVSRRIRTIVPNSTSISGSGSASGTVIINSNASGGNGTFPFTSSGNASLPGSFSITTSGGAGDQTYSNVVPGTYSISESVPAGWSLASASCNDGSSSFSKPTVSNIKVAAGATVTCSFNNIYSPPEVNLTVDTVQFGSASNGGSVYDMGYSNAPKLTWSSTNTSSCSLTSNNGDNKTGTSGTNVTANTIADDTDGSGHTWTYTLSCNGKSTSVNVVVPPAPTNPQASCPVPGTAATLSWTAPPGLNTFYVRNDDVTSGMPADSHVYWNESYTGSSYAIPDNYSGLEYPVNPVPGHNYSMWIHTRTPNGAYSMAVGTNYTCTGGSPPTIIAMSQSPNYKLFSVGWYGGSGNGGAGGCKLQFFASGTTWTDIASASSLNCDAYLSSNFTLNGDGWKANWNGTDVRILRKSDSKVLGTFSTKLVCISKIGSSYQTPSIDEDCNGYWDNTKPISQTVDGCPNGQSCMDLYESGYDYCPSGSNYYGYMYTQCTTESAGCTGYPGWGSKLWESGSGCTYTENTNFYY